MRHVPAKDHVSADGLSRRPKAPEDPDDEEDPEEWIDSAKFFGMECLNSDARGEYNLQEKPSKTGKTVTFSIHMNKAIEDRARNGEAKRGSILKLETLKIPRSDEAKKREERLEHIKIFLEDPEQRPEMSEKEFRRFVSSVCRSS